MAQVLIGFRGRLGRGGGGGAAGPFPPAASAGGEVGVDGLIAICVVDGWAVRRGLGLLVLLVDVLVVGLGLGLLVLLVDVLVLVGLRLGLLVVGFGPRLVVVLLVGILVVAGLRLGLVGVLLGPRLLVVLLDVLLLVGLRLGLRTVLLLFAAVGVGAEPIAVEPAAGDGGTAGGVEDRTGGDGSDSGQA